MIGRALVVAALAVASATALSCNVNEYCINCAVNRDGGFGDGGPDDAADAGDGGTTGDAGDGGPCVPTGDEVCDGEDNDCDGETDEAPLPEVGEACDNQTGECEGSTKQCVAGAITCAPGPQAEICDGKDNDCNGLIDEGDPGGGAKCGTDSGECVAGTLHCNTSTHQIECFDAIGGITPPFGTAESCDGKDNDCDNQFDEGVGALGSCGGGLGADPNAGTCQTGTLQCVGGGTVCIGAIGPSFEACDDDDNDCDGKVDEDTAKANDPQNCGSCGFVCNLPNAFEGCAGGACTIAACQADFHDNNDDPSDGCEFGPCTSQGDEVCNGVDDDCDPDTDEQDLAPPDGLCLTEGACAGATASCQGADGFRCAYGPEVSQDASGNIVPETACDGVDNDCDGNVDEGQPNLGQACSDGNIGACQGTGTFECDANDPDGPAVCVITAPGQAAGDEACDGDDNDCDGTVDEGAEGGDLPGQDWVTIPATTPAIEIMKYEASRPDASATSSGGDEVFACSKQGVQPWTNVTQPQAEAACASIGARLCTELEWQKMCDPAPSYPVAAPTNTTDFAVVEVESAFAIAAGSGRTWTFQQPPTQLQDFSGIGAMQALPDNGTTISRNNAPGDAPRLEFQFALAASTDYTIWVRMMGANSNGDSVFVGMGTTSAPAVNLTGNGGISTNPDGVWTWVQSSTFTSGAAGNYIAAIYMREDGVRVDAVAITRNPSTAQPPLDKRTWAYKSNPKIAQPTTCNADDLDTDGGVGGDQDDVLPTGSLATCFGNGPGSNDAFDMSGNVKEWTRERAANQNPLRGGASNNTVDGTACGLNFTLADDDFFFPNVGFRCCRVK